MTKIKQLIKKQFENNRQFLTYAAIGAVGAGLDFIIFIVLNQKLGVYHLYANIISTMAGITTNFFLNIFYNFRVRDFLWQRFLSFYAVGLLGLLLTSGLLYLFTDLLGFHPVIVKLGTLIVVLIVQFTLNKYISFRYIPKS